MIICPACKEGIEDDSYFCDQCGQELSFCKQCGHVGLGRRCTRCGGLMVSRHEKAVERQPMASVNVNVANVYAAQRVSSSTCRVAEDQAFLLLRQVLRIAVCQH